MSFPITMKIKTDVYGTVLSCNPVTSAEYYDTTLCATVENAQVSVYNIGLPDPYGAEFLYYFKPSWDLSKLQEYLAKARTTPEYQEACFYVALCATNGWGHANSRCFTP